MSGLVRAKAVSARLVDHDWAWAEANVAAITSNWERRRARTPAIFNGRVLMVTAIRDAGERCEADFFATDYANLLGWMDAGSPDATVANGFAMGALRTADGAFVLGRMAPHTANAGKLYFPCGTPDLSDVTASREVDLAGSLLREIAEETGIGAVELTLEPDWTIVREGGLVAFMRIARLEMAAETARDRILAHLAADPRPELSEIRLVRSLAEIDGEPVPPVVPAFLRHAFAAAQR